MMPRREKPHYRLEAWRQAIELTAAADEVAARFPPEKRLGMMSQLRRAAVSVPLNLSEGAGRETTAAFCRFPYIARGSATEIDTIFVLAIRLGYATAE